MKKNLLVVTILIVALISFTFGIYADTLRQEITAMLTKDVKITLNGEEYVSRDANGETTYPIIYNGSTYLPVRGLANMYGSKVTWDNATRTVGLWSPDYVPGQGDGYIPETEMNNSIKNANDFELGGKMKGIVGEEFADTGDKDEYDYFKFVVKEAGVVTFTVNADHESEFEFELRNRQDELYESIDMTDEDTLTFKAPMDPGIYYFNVSAYYKAPYKIESSFESFNNPAEVNNDELTNAGTIALNTVIKCSLGGYQEEYSSDSPDYYTFEEPLDSITVELNHPGHDSVRVYIYSTGGETLESFDSEMGKINETFVPYSEDKIGFISIEGGQYPYQLYEIKITE